MVPVRVKKPMTVFSEETTEKVVKNNRQNERQNYQKVDNDNCLYEQNFVCKFAPKEGFINYLTREVYRSYRELRTQGFKGKDEGARIWGDSQKGLVIGSLREASERSLEESPIRS